MWFWIVDCFVSWIFTVSCCCSSIWFSLFQVYYVYGFMLLVFIILIIVTVCVTIVGTYFLLNAENYHWQWTSFFSAASTAIYVYLYSIYYYHVKTKMSGFFQTSFYFGYTMMFCLGLGMLCGKLFSICLQFNSPFFPSCPFYAMIPFHYCQLRRILPIMLESCWVGLIWKLWALSVLVPSHH